MPRTIAVTEKQVAGSRKKYEKLIAADPVLRGHKEQLKLEHDAHVVESEKLLKSGGSVQKQQVCEGLQPYFALSPMHTSYYYSPGSGEPTIDARLYFYGGHMGGNYSTYHLPDFCAEDRYVIGYGVTPLSDEANLTDIST